MTIQAALNAASSSLAFEQRQMQVIANNIANASTPGYAEETLPGQEQVANGFGVGVEPATLQRLANQMLATSANQTAGAQAYSQAMLDRVSGFTQAVGAPSDPSSLSGTLSAFQQALTTLSATPGDATTQAAAASAAGDLVGAFHTADQAVATAREQADQAVAQDVSQANSLLSQLGQNQTAMRLAAANGQPTASFEDTRDSLLASLAKIVPINVLSDGANGVVVTSDGGTTLFDQVPKTLDFTPTASISSESTGLSGVTVDGQPRATSQSGSLAANLQARDVTLPQFAAQSDALAANLIGAFQSADPTVASGQAGLFTDAGNPLDPAATAGLAGRIALNASADPSQGGAAWRMSAGAQAATPAPASDSSTVVAFLDAMSAPQNYPAASGLSGSFTLGDAAAQIGGLQQSALATWTSKNDDRTQQAKAAQTALGNATGVNVDQELQRLLIVQQTYSASAQVLQVASNMLAALNNAVAASA